MRAQALAEAVTHLPWIAPCAASLVKLAQPAGSSRWLELRTDPGCVLLTLRFTAKTPFSPALMYDPALLQGALHLFDQPGSVDWDKPGLRLIYQTALTFAELASRLAAKTGRTDPDAAWTAGLLAPLGWLAVGTTDPQAAANCLNDPDHGASPAIVQKRYWGLDQADIARRLVRRWGLPTWLGASAGHLAMPVTVAETLGAAPDLFRLVQLAVGLVQRTQPGLGLAVGSLPAEIAAELGLSAEDLDKIMAETHPATIHLPAQSGVQGTNWAPPSSVPLLRDLLNLALENRRLSDAPVLDGLENELDILHASLAQQQASETSRLQVQKLATLAEFAAGAGHEINNPLAVISGQAQYLLGHLRAEDRRQKVESSCPTEEGERDESASSLPSAYCLLPAGADRGLQTIIKQAQRIHDILNQLMQFARPSRPQKRPLELAGLCREVTAALAGLAEQRTVRLVCPDPVTPLVIQADPRQIGLALTCLLRNAIEAAPPEGWAGIRAALTSHHVELMIEDSGPGPAPHHRPHLFDPFFSGRQAGRGRGLGLPTAWRLAREHGGDVYFDDRSASPTRFVLRLPRHAAGNGTPVNGSAGHPIVGVTATLAALDNIAESA